MKGMNLKMKWLLFLGLGIISTGCLDDSDDDDSQGNWTKVSDFEGVTRSGAVSFSIGEKAYVATGYTGTEYLSDLWEYDPSLNFWLRKADFPGVKRSAAVAFSVNGKGYVGTGYDGLNNLGDFWEYDPATDAWRQVADFGGSARYGAVAFNSSTNGYVGTGYDGNDLKDFWTYDPAANEWTQVISIGGSKRVDAVAFTIDNKAYVGTGRNNGVYQYDFWAYDMVAGTWQQMLDLDDDDDYLVVRHNAVAFSRDGKGYITTGNFSGLLVSTWEYDPITDLWSEYTGIEGPAREDAVAFVAGSRIFVTTGRSSTVRLDDIWEFKPEEVYDEDL